MRGMLIYGFCRKFCVADARGMIAGECIQRDSTTIEFKGGHFERDVIPWGVRWYVGIRPAIGSSRK